MKGTLHTDDLDNIMQCITDPKEIVDDFESAIAAFSADKMDMSQVMGSLQSISLSVKKLVDATKSCNNEHTTQEL
jgi:hypothetical protein